MSVLAGVVLIGIAAALYAWITTMDAIRSWVVCALKLYAERTEALRHE